MRPRQSSDQRDFGRELNGRQVGTINSALVIQVTTTTITATANSIESHLEASTRRLGSPAVHARSDEILMSRVTLSGTIAGICAVALILPTVASAQLAWLSQPFVFKKEPLNGTATAAYGVLVYLHLVFGLFNVAAVPQPAAAAKPALVGFAQSDAVRDG
jgi:hypothetical protein